MKDSLRHERSDFGRFLRGSRSAAGVLGVPLGGWWCPDVKRLDTPQRREQGYVVVLPGIDGWGWLARNLVLGLEDGGVATAIDVADWTTGHFWFFFRHLFDHRRNHGKALEVAERIARYQAEYPGRPVHVLAHSGGNAIALGAIEALPADRGITRGILLAPAVSPDYDLTRALRRAEHGIHVFHSPLDFPLLGLGTLAFGTLDRRHTPAAGLTGFVVPEGLDPESKRLYETHLHQQPFRPAMASSWNFGGHCGWMNRVFVEEWLAPLVRS